jgi:hypothetical protein
MARIEQPSNGHGSLKDIQLLVNKNVGLIDAEIKKAFPELANDIVWWHSPLEVEAFAEYRDEDFLDKLWLMGYEPRLKEFWPSQGPQWDALAVTQPKKNHEKKYILVEAKANIPEIISPPTKASPKSKELIDKSFKETKDYLEIKDKIDWSGKFYQYTNRLAHLYFLRIKCELPAYLVNIYFVGDKSVHGPETIAEWKAALQVLHSYLGLGKHKLRRYIADVFINVKELDGFKLNT